MSHLAPLPDGTSSCLPGCPHKDMTSGPTLANTPSCLSGKKRKYSDFKTHENPLAANAIRKLLGVWHF